MMKTNKLWQIIIYILIAGSVLAAIKVIFFDYTLDEEYQIMMSYRNLSGDKLFREMWEPHQTSSFLCTILMWLYRTVTGTYTGVLLYLRVCTTAIQVGISFYLYKVLCGLTRKDYALLLTLTYFNIVPKIIQIPEFANMQVWFFTLLVLPLLQYYQKYEERRKWNWLYPVAAGVAMSLEVLSYPTCLLLFPFFLVYIFICSKGRRWRDVLLFAGTCATSAGIWLLLVLRNLSFSDFVRNVKLLLAFDLTHEISGATMGKGEGILVNAFWAVILLIVCAAAGGIVLLALKRREKEWNAGKVITLLATAGVIVSGVIQLVLWVVWKSGYETYQLHLFVTVVAALAVAGIADDRKKMLYMGILGTLVSYAVVIYISDLQMYYALPHGTLGVVFAVLVLLYALEEAWKEKSRILIALVLTVFCFVCVFGKGYTLREGRNYQVVVDTENVMKYGPAVGILTNYMNAYIYNSNYEDFSQYIRPEDTVLIVAGMVDSESTTPYMFGENAVAHYSIVDPTAYDERLLEYWELYPEKEPDVIVVDCWYGELKESPDNWIMQYIENSFGYTEVHDGKYVRFYRR